MSSSKKISIKKMPDFYARNSFNSKILGEIKDIFDMVCQDFLIMSKSWIKAFMYFLFVPARDQGIAESETYVCSKAIPQNETAGAEKALSGH